MPRVEAYGSSFVCLSVIMPRAELPRYTVIVLSVSQSVSLSFTSISRRSLQTKRQNKQHKQNSIFTRI